MRIHAQSSMEPEVFGGCNLRSTLGLPWRQVCHRVEVVIACRAEAELTRPRSSRCTTETAKTTAETG